ncbi:alpha-mannosidase [Paenibacillus sp. HW567]|uniref:alpha-mannosidase n=1 Tax=Paenibacillus sp. HW567 TaxID=1034769 RepID=UPI00036BACF7|nr:glycoside hydrolase family 38 C-terminal domain-containing protein [Paenibacillus sp. HW567]
MERIKRLIRELSERQWLERRALEEWDIQASVYTVPGQYDAMRPYTEGNFSLFPSVQGTTYFFRRTLVIPREWERQHAGLIFESGGEGLLRVNGESRQGLDRNHTFVTLEAAPDGRPLELEIELFDPIPEPVDPLNQQAVIQPPIRAIRTELVLVNVAVQSLMYSSIIVRDAAILLPEADLRRARMLEALYRVMDEFLNLSEAAIREGKAAAALEEKLRAGIAGIGGNAEGTIHMVGQSHIDIAWLWPARETVRKTSRTFSTVHALMEEYPEYQFAQSQPQLFAYLKENDPVLFAKVKERIREGRWELVGGMWVEPDLNIPSGESLMRQMLYGQRFYLEEFGKTSDIEWLPDTFGYCASLPQILRHGGVHYFMTTKLGWNDTNVFPYDLFHWVGIDGTAMLSYLNHGVNENTLPKDVHDHWQSFREKKTHNEQMLLYGHGDGGGGVTREMLEYIRRAELMVGQPASQISSAADFFAGIRERQPKLPEWRGDLYLELHRGTYTTHGRNKRNNRKVEILYREAELWQTVAASFMKPEERSSSVEQLHKGWKLVLLNQFHDIIPGSAITEAYETSEKEYREVFTLGQSALQPGLQALAGQVAAVGEGTPYVLFNSLGWARDVVAAIPVPDQPDHTELENAALADTQPASTGWTGTELTSAKVTNTGLNNSGLSNAELAKTTPTKATTAGKTSANLTWAAYDEDGHSLSVDLVSESSAATGSTEQKTAYIYVPQIPAFGYKTIWLRREETSTEPITGSVGGMKAATGVTAPFTGAASAETTEAVAAAEHTPLTEYAALNDSWDTPYYRFTFNERGEITSLFDKTAGREIVQPGGRANRFHFFHDRPTLWDAWDIDSRYEDQPAGEAELVSKYVLHSGKVQDVLRFHWKLGQSEITQDLILYANDRRMDFKTHVEWNEAHKLLKVGFPVDVVADKATYEIPFGALERPTHRNTCWEQAQYEVCGHRFADVSEHGYGVSLLNDCKYGYDVQGSTIRLSLLRAPKWPDITADLGSHDFTYSLYPHEGDWRSAHTLRKAAELNHEVPAFAATMKTGQLPSTGALIGFNGQQVVLDTVKLSEDGQGSILRLYESSGGREAVKLGWKQPFNEVHLSNALEQKLEPVAHHQGEFELHFAPFEIKTIYIR